MNEETYRITPLGLLCHTLGDEDGKRAFDALDLYCRRHGCGIAINKNALLFVELEPVPEVKP